MISTTALLSAGLSPLSASANIHFAELLTGGLSGAFHARRGQVSLIAGVAPQVAVGSSIVAEFVVTAVHVTVFAGLGGLLPEISMAGLLAGGVIAAPIAPRLAAQLPPRIIITLVGLAVVIASTVLIVR